MPNEPIEPTHYRNESDNYVKLILQQLEFQQNALSELRSECKEKVDKLGDDTYTAIANLSKKVEDNFINHETRLTAVTTKAEDKIDLGNNIRWLIAMIVAAIGTLYSFLGKPLHLKFH